MTGFQFYNQLDPGAKKKKKNTKNKIETDMSIEIDGFKPGIMPKIKLKIRGIKMGNMLKIYVSQITLKHRSYSLIENQPEL